MMEAVQAGAAMQLWGALQMALATCAVLVATVVFAQPLHAPLRQALQPALVRIVTSQLVWVEWVQRTSHPLLDALASASAASVSIEFYLSALPLLFWCGQQLMVFRLVCVLVLSNYLTFGLKDILSAPRPADVVATLASTTDGKDGSSGRSGGNGKHSSHSRQDSITSPLRGSDAAGAAAKERAPRIRVVNPSGDIEDGVPSAHCALTVPMYLHAITCAVDSGLVPAQWALPLRVAALAWTGVVAWGRLYLGVHSPIDLGVGAALGLCVLALWRLVEAPFVAWVLADVNLPSWLMLASFAAMKLHPVATRFTHCYQYTTCWLGAAAGAVLGSWQWGLAQRAAPVHQELWATGATAAYALLALKLSMGFAVVLATKVVAKQLLLRLLPPLFDSAPLHLRLLWQPPVAFAPPQQGDDSKPASAAKLAEAASAPAAADDSSTSSSDSSGSDSAAVRVRVTVAPLGACGLVRSCSGGGKVTVACNPAGVPWDVDSTARFLSYMAAVNLVWTFPACWALAGL